MGLKQIKLEFFYVRKSFFQYKKGFQYIKNKYFLSKKVLKSNKILESPANHQDYSIHILTCHQDLVMTIWALASFYKVSSVIGLLYIHDDGSLTQADKKQLNKFFPSSILVESSKFLENFEETLNAYPVLKKFRSTYNNFSFKKIIDPYFVSDKKFHLILDSDVLWFKQPTELESVLQGQENKSFMQYNNISIPVTFKDGNKTDDKISKMNAGIILYSKENFDVDKLSQFLEKLDTSIFKNLHFADQAGHAYCLKNLEALPARYKIKGEVNQATVVRHYTGPRRPLFYIEGLELLKNKFF